MEIIRENLLNIPFNIQTIKNGNISISGGVELNVGEKTWGVSGS